MRNTEDFQVLLQGIKYGIDTTVLGEEFIEQSSSSCSVTYYWYIYLTGLKSFSLKYLLYRVRNTTQL